MSSSACAPRPPSTSSPHHPPVSVLRIPRLSPSTIYWTCIDTICLICSSPSKVSSHPLLTCFLLFICELILKRLHLTSPFVSVSPSVTEGLDHAEQRYGQHILAPRGTPHDNQDGRSIESYVEEFLHLIHQVNWNDDTLKIVFWSGLNNHLFLSRHPPLPQALWHTISSWCSYWRVHLLLWRKFPQARCCRRTLKNRARLQRRIQSRLH